MKVGTRAQTAGSLFAWMVRIGVGLGAIKIVGMFFLTDLLGPVATLGYFGVVVPMCIVWCVFQIQETHETGVVSLYGEDITRDQDLTKFTMYLSTYWVTIVMASAFEVYELANLILKI